MNPIPARIKLYLLKLGFQPNLKGYRLLARLIALAQEGTEVMPLKYFGYKRLAEEFGASEASVEKDIQNAISAAWLRGSVDVLYAEFGETLDEDKGKPTNKQFLLTALERAVRKQRKIRRAPLRELLFVLKTARKKRAVCGGAYTKSQVFHPLSTRICRGFPVPG